MALSGQQEGGWSSVGSRREVLPAWCWLQPQKAGVLTGVACTDACGVKYSWCHCPQVTFVTTGPWGQEHVPDVCM